MLKGRQSCDSMNGICLAMNHVQHDKIKYIDIIYHFL